MSIKEWLQRLEVNMEARSGYTPSIRDRIGRRILAPLLRGIGIPRVDLIETIVVHGAALQMPRSHGLPNLVRRSKFYDSALPNLVRKSNQRLGRPVNVVDVGANIGDTAGIIAHVVGRDEVSFVCIEPDPRYMPYLKANTGGLRALIIEALAGATTTNELGRFVSATGTSYFQRGDGEPFPMVRVDDAVSDRIIDILKIDTDGFELPVLQGATRILEHDSPLLFIEVSPLHWRLVGGYDPMSVVSLLLEFGYKECLIYDGAGYPISAGGLDAPFVKHIMNYGRSKPVTYFDFLVSKEKLDDFYQEEITRVGQADRWF